MNTFQAVLVTDGQLSFVTFNYGVLEWAIAYYGLRLVSVSSEQHVMVTQDCKSDKSL